VADKKAKVEAGEGVEASFARLFDPRTKDQIEAFIHGHNVYWWFSDETIQEHRSTTRASVLYAPLTKKSNPIINQIASR
jgi:hypothetical protein